MCNYGGLFGNLFGGFFDLNSDGLVSPEEDLLALAFLDDLEEEIEGDFLLESPDNFE